MSNVLEHNPRLPMPREVLPINPDFVMLDGVEELDMNRVIGFWTPTERQSHLLNESGRRIAVISSLVGEAMNQLAAYALMHGAKETRLPYLTGVDLRGLYPVFTGQPIKMTLDIKAKGNTYTAKGELVNVRESKLAYYGLIRGVLLGQDQTWIDSRPYSPRESGVRAPARKKRPSLDRSHELYQRIISVDRIPKLEPRSDEPAVNFTIENDNVISIDERAIILDLDSTFVLNALLLNLGREITRGEVEDMGFSSGNTPSSRQASFSISKLSLARRLRASSGRQLLLEKVGEKRRGYHQLDPNIEYAFYDRRQEAQS